jgi:hypothetical protein
VLAFTALVIGSEATSAAISADLGPVKRNRARDFLRVPDCGVNPALLYGNSLPSHTRLRHVAYPRRPAGRPVAFLVSGGGLPQYQQTVTNQSQHGEVG